MHPIKTEMVYEALLFKMLKSVLIKKKIACLNYAFFSFLFFFFLYVGNKESPSTSLFPLKFEIRSKEFKELQYMLPPY